MSAQTPSVTTAPARPEFGPEATSNTLEILDSTIHWVEHGEGSPIVFLHGNPTSSFLWRGVFSGLRGRGRLLAPDLIGFGDSGKPDIAYDLDDHQRYLNAWFDALDLRDVTLVVQDYGAAFGITWARNNPDRVSGLVIAEPVLRPIDSAALPAEFVALRGEVLKDGIGEQIVLEENRFITGLLPSAVLDGLPDEVQAVYAAPFPTPESRRPILVFPRSLPVDAKPQSTVDFLAANEQWLATSPIPKALFTFEPGFLLTPEIVEWAKSNIAELEVTAVGRGSHYVQEDSPAEIAAAVGAFLDVHRDATA
ncbi:haloalkane dehalogenase [Gordonia soli]|uniref:Haloalkane dehalogenase n=1 Tax=Gordonia soli NBRC 108243 TaxID=1223545 RepID=M0QQL5_9ACTN|nr:haloalkane dehalogenase [Gordonia soli]GAC70970.1 haloalkane dehalogenase [Gordonia soli NBRC 108243]